MKTTNSTDKTKPRVPSPLEYHMEHLTGQFIFQKAIKAEHAALVAVAERVRAHLAVKGQDLSGLATALANLDAIRNQQSPTSS